MEEMRATRADLSTAQKAVAAREEQVAVKETMLEAAIRENEGKLKELEGKLGRIEDKDRMIMSLLQSLVIVDKKKSRAESDRLAAEQERDAAVAQCRLLESRVIDLRRERDVASRDLEYAKKEKEVLQVKLDHLSSLGSRG